MNIRTYSERTPWGIEWTAICDDLYDGGDDRPIAGVGSTEEEALEDFKIGLEQINVYL